MGHLKDDKERKEFIDLLKHQSNGPVLTRLKSILTQRMQAINRQEINVDEYENTSWAYKQAHQNGLRSAYQKILDLLGEKN